MNSHTRWVKKIGRFGTLTGLRPAEILESVRLIIDDDDNQTFQKYYGSKQMVLQRWKFRIFSLGRLRKRLCLSLALKLYKT
jgi:hypothetical protein